MYLKELIEAGLTDSPILVKVMNKGYLKHFKEEDDYKVLVTTNNPIKAKKFTLNELLGSSPYKDVTELEEVLYDIKVLEAHELELYLYNEMYKKVSEDYLKSKGLLFDKEELIEE